jgi:hypothetical protein
MTNHFNHTTPVCYTGLNTFKKTLIATSIAIAVSACSSSSSDSTAASDSPAETETPVVESVSVTGTVADGYLQGATVCLDLNDNKECDDGEPKATSTEGGAFTLDGATQAQIDLHAIVVEIVEGVTVDEDNPDTVIEQGYSMAAPAGYTFVSPLTTMVQQEVEENEGNEGFSLEDAEAAIQTKLGTDVDLSQDFVAAKGEDSDFSAEDKAEFEKLHKVAQVTARILQANIENVETAVEDLDISFAQVLDMVVGQVLDALETINSEVETKIEEAEEEGAEAFDPDVVAVNDALTEELAVDVDSVEDDIATRQAEKETVSANLLDLVSSVGINMFDADHHDGELGLFYGSFQYNAETEESAHTGFGYDAESDSFVAESDDNNDKEYLLSDEGWVLASKSEKISVNEDGSINIINAELTSYAERLDAQQFNVSGLNISSTLSNAGRGGDLWAQSVDPSAIFSETALAFKLRFTTLNDQYKMWAGDDCQEDQIVGGMCNSVWANTGDGDWETDGHATTLESITSASATTPTDPSELKGVQVAWYNHASVYAQIITGGTVNFYHVEYFSNGPGEVKLLSEGTWEDKTIGGQTIRLMELPVNVLGDGNFDYRDRFIFFTEKDEFLRRGHFSPADTVEHGEVVFNIAAKNDIVDAFDNTRFDEIASHLTQREEQKEQLAEEEGFIQPDSDASSHFDPNKECEAPNDGTSTSTDESTATDGSTATDESTTDGQEGVADCSQDQTGDEHVDDGSSTDTTGDDTDRPEITPLETTLEACEVSNSTENSDGSFTLTTKTVFDAAVVSCGNAIAFNSTHLLGKIFVDANNPHERVQFLDDGTASIIKKLPDGTDETEPFTWAFNDANELITNFNPEANDVERDTVVLLQASDTELSIKSFTEDSKHYEGADFDGTKGDIWSTILVVEPAKAE